MKNFVKYAAVGLAGYFIGFYEMKYKAMKIMLNATVEEQGDDIAQDSKEEGSQ